MQIDYNGILQDWIASRATFNVFSTVTLKQAIQNDNLGFSRITPEDCRKTGWLLRDRLTKEITKLAGLKRRTQIPFAVFIEGHSKYQRYHLHNLSVCPDGVSLWQYQDVMLKVCKRLDWAYRQIKVEAINRSNIDSERLLHYCLKEKGRGGGLGVFCPEASFLPV
jgi:hypothetical protein